MKKIIIFLFVLFAFANLQAQDYEISFAATGVTTNLETVFVENLTQGTSVTVQGSDILHLVGTSQIEELDNDNLIHIYPNPLTSSSKIEFKIPSNAPVTLTLLDAAGKSIISIQKELEAGTHLFEISDLKSGFYTIKIASPKFVYSEPIISHSKSNGPVSISYLTSCNDNEGASYLKSLESIITMQYTTGDNLRFTGYSGNYTAIVTDIPTQSKTITFNFIAPATLATITTLVIANISQTNATCGGNIVTNGGAEITSSGICWSPNPNPTITDDKTTDGTTISSFASSISGLTANTTYYVRAYATNSVGTAYGNEVSFTTQQAVILQLPTVTTTAATNIVSTIATSGGNITSNGGATVTVSGVCWSTLTTPTITSSKTTDGATIGSYSSSITGLTANTTYYVRAYATNSVGTAYGNQITFTTNAALTMPSLTTMAASSIGATYASSGGIISSNGGDAITASGICWSTSTLPTTANSKTNIGATSGTFFSSITGLTANTTYYLRAYATNNIGTAYGNQVSFTTSAAATIPTLTTIKSSDIQTTTATINGEITSNGGATITVSGVCWSTSSLPTILNSKTTDGTLTGLYSSSLTGLTANTMYYARAYATNSVGTAYGAEVVFTTNPVFTLPTLTTYTADNIGGTTASSGGNISSNGGTPITASGICWSTSTSPTTSDSKTSQGFTIGAFASTLTGLTANTTYYVRAYATNSVGTAYGNQITFTTNAANSIPTLTTTAASSIAQTTAISGGTISSNGGATITASGICWSTSASPTTSDSKTTYGILSGSFSSTLTGLTANTTYYVRAYATNSVGTAYGNEVSFTTSQLIPGTVTDYDGNVYNTVTIGTQTWMTKDLKVTKYNDGTVIPNITDATAWSNLTTPSYCWYNNDQATYGNTNGAYYNWYAVETNKLCPTGWHVPTDAEWTILSTYLGGEAIAGGKLKQTGTVTWTTPNTGATNSSGFTAIANGSRVGSTGAYSSIGLYVPYWSSSAGTSGNAYYISLGNARETVYRNQTLNNQGFSVRCLSDVTQTASVPTLTTTAISAITATNATSGGTISSDGGATITTSGICWNTTTAPTIVNSKTTNGTTTGTYVSSLTGLTSNTTYYVRAYATNSAGTAYGNEISFTTLTQVLVIPTLTTTAVSSIAQTTATSGGTISSNGGAAITASGICWSTSATPTTGNSKTTDGATIGSFTSSMTGLTANTTYYVRAYATNSVGTAYGNQISFTTLAQVTTGICDAIDNCNTTITSSGVLPWLSQSIITHDGVDAGQSGGITSSQISAMQTTIVGPVDISFWWKVSSEATYDYLSFYIDGVLQEKISGEVNWTQKAYYLVAGTHTLKWEYSKDNSTAAGSDCGWIDQLTVTPSTNTIPTLSATTAVSSIASLTAVSGGTISSNGGATITASGVCWSTIASPTITDSKSIDGAATGTFTSNLAGLSANTTYYVRAYATNAVGTAYGPEVSFTTLTATVTPLCDAIDYCDRTITTTGNASWAIQAVNTHDATDAAQSGVIANSQSTTMETTIVGPVDISFWWKVSSEATYDYLTFYINGVYQTSISGTVNWAQLSYFLQAGTNTIKWVYAKDNTTAAGSDCGWVDQLTVATSTKTIPTITTAAVSTITQTTATSVGTIVTNGGGTITTSGVCWSTTPNPTIASTKMSGSTATGSITFNLTGLTANTTYYLRAFATNAAGTAYGNEVSFTTTQLQIPTLTTKAMIFVFDDSAVSGADIQSNGGTAITASGFCWSTSPNPTTVNSKTVDVPSSNTFNSYITGLTEATTYYLRAYATNSVGTAYGNEISFTTILISLPTVTTTAITSIAASTAVSGGTISSNGGGTISESGICWNTSPNPTIANSKNNTGLTSGTYSSTLTSLSATTTYYVRAYATNSKGTAYGNEVSFVSAALPTNGLCDAIDYCTVAINSTGTTQWALQTTTTHDGVDAAKTGIITNSQSTTMSATIEGPVNISFWWKVSSESGYDILTFYINNVVQTNFSGEYNWEQKNYSLPAGTNTIKWVYAKDNSSSYGSDCGWVDQFVVSPITATIPVISTNTISNIQGNSAQSGGSITSNGGSALLSKGVCWSETPNPTILNDVTNEGTATIGYTSNLSGLKANTLYYVRAYATNIIGTAYGNEVSFTTLPVTLPSISTTTPTNITSISASCGGTIISNGSGTLTSGICWSTSQNPTTSNNKTTDGLQTGTFTSSLTGLLPSTIYYIRAYATNNAGTAYGNEVSLTTAYGVIDIDGNIYDTIMIGSQIWMKQDLKVSKYKNGDIIGTTAFPNTDITTETNPQYEWQNTGAPGIFDSYGRLYTWYAISDSRGACPQGWRIPTNDDWNTLATSVGGTSIAGGKLKDHTTTYWTSPNYVSTTPTEFGALPNGVRYGSGTFGFDGDEGYYWTTEENGTGYAYTRLFSNNGTNVTKYSLAKISGASVRCIKE